MFLGYWPRESVRLDNWLADAAGGGRRERERESQQVNERANERCGERFKGARERDRETWSSLASRSLSLSIFRPLETSFDGFGSDGGSF